MPRYDYVCIKCKKEYEVEQSMSDPPFEKHIGPKGKTCGPVKRLISASNFHLKGSGWSKDGYGPNPGKKSGKE